jgi:UDP-N-acetyl-D-glucosamine dehydrogenase
MGDPMSVESWRQSYRENKIKVGVVGLGYVGLPLAVSFAKQGHEVLGFDIDGVKTNQINEGKSYIPDVEESEVERLVSGKLLEATTAFARLSECDAISVCVPTPLRKTREPDLTYIIEAMTRVVEFLRPGQLIVLESTTYPGTTVEVVAPRIEETGLTIGTDVFLAFSPERIDPGNAVYTVENTPKIIGGMTPNCSEIAALLYATSVGEVIKVSSPTTAEMVKLLENTFRAVNIGLVNEISLMANKLGLDVWEIIEAAASKPFGFMPFYPGPGLGGHCIPIDPHYLSWKLKTLNYRARFIELAEEVNGAMPDHVVQLVSQALNEDAKAVRGSKVLVLGVAYKPDITDCRESPAISVIKSLQSSGAEVTYQDDYVPYFELEHGHGAGALKSVELEYERLADFDCVVIITHHSYFDGLKILECARRVVDTRNLTGRAGTLSEKVIKL